MLILSWILKNTPLCTTIGPKHHQIWNLRICYVNKISELFYGIVCYASYFMVKVDISYYIEGAIIAISYLFCSIVYHKERFSMWCWTCGVLLIAYILDPQIIKLRDHVMKTKKQE